MFTAFAIPCATIDPDPLANHVDQLRQLIQARALELCRQRRIGFSGREFNCWKFCQWSSTRRISASLHGNRTRVRRQRHTSQTRRDHFRRPRVFRVTVLVGCRASRSESSSILSRFPASGSRTRLHALLSRATPSVVSEHSLELIGCPISMSFTTYCVCLELRFRQCCSAMLRERKPQQFVKTCLSNDSQATHFRV